MRRTLPIRFPRAGAAGARFATALGDERVELLAARALHWPRERTAFVADVHLGKAAAFRAGGVPLPRGSTAADLTRLAAVVLHETGAQRLVVLGDFLHGAAGRVAALDTAFRAWRSRHAAIDIVLVRGNHDDRAGYRPPTGTSPSSPNRIHSLLSSRAMSRCPRAPGTRCAATCILASRCTAPRTNRSACPASCSAGAAPSCRRSASSPVLPGRRRSPAIASWPSPGHACSPCRPFSCAAARDGCRNFATRRTPFVGARCGGRSGG